MSRYLARFFRHPATGKQQRHLMLADGSWVLGEWIGPDVSMNVEDPGFLERLGSGEIVEAMSEARFLEEDFDNRAICVMAFERLANDARAAGFTERDIDDRMVDDIPATALIKPQWKRDVDQGWLALLAGRHEIALADTGDPAAEPIVHYIRAQIVFARDTGSAAEARRLLEAARDDIAQRRALKLPVYAWTLGDQELEASIYESLFWVADSQGDHPTMLAAIRRATEVATDERRSEALAFVQSHIYVEYIDDAFETAFQYGNVGFDAIKSHPDFAAFARRRRREQKSGVPIVRWRSMNTPSTPADIQSAETLCGIQFPDDYRHFLNERGESTLMFHLGNESTQLRFAGAQDFGAWQQALQEWFDIMRASDGQVFDHWSATYGVDRHALFSVAPPWDNSACLALCLRPGPRYGHGFWWDHDEPGDLVPLGTSFADCLATIERRFTAGDAALTAMLRINSEDS